MKAFGIGKTCYGVMQSKEGYKVFEGAVVDMKIRSAGVMCTLAISGNQEGICGYVVAFDNDLCDSREKAEAMARARERRTGCAAL